jgi:hypothetical protein
MYIECLRDISPPSFPFGLSLQGFGGKSLSVVMLSHDAPARANASPLLHKQHAAEEVVLEAELIEAAHVACGVDTMKCDGAHDSDHHRFNLVEDHFVASWVIELSRARRPIIA